jgi:hypothetical protein
MGADDKLGQLSLATYLNTGIRPGAPMAGIMEAQVIQCSVGGLKDSRIIASMRWIKNTLL